jgi:hypothetical protein
MPGIKRTEATQLIPASHPNSGERMCLACSLRRLAAMSFEEKVRDREGRHRQQREARALPRIVPPPRPTHIPSFSVR